MNNPLNELSAVYNQSIAGDDKKKEKVKAEMIPQGDTPVGGDGARPGKNRKAYVEPMSYEGYAPGDVDQKVGAVTAIPKDEREAAKARLLAKAKAKREAMKEHVSWRDDLHEYVGSVADNNNVVKTSPKKDTEAAKEIKEKNVKNKIKINPPQGVTEGFEQLGGVVVEMYELTEKIDLKKADMGEVIKDFRKSDAPQFKGKSDKKIQKMAIAAKLEADEAYDMSNAPSIKDAKPIKKVNVKYDSKMKMMAPQINKEETEEEKKKREMLAKTKEHDDKHDGKLAEQSGGGLDKLGPRAEGKRKEKGRSKPQAIRQSKARLAALKKRLQVEEMSVKDQMAFSREYNRKRKEGLLPKRPAAKPVANTDNRSSAEKMADAYASPRKGPGGATRAD